MYRKLIEHVNSIGGRVAKKNKMKKQQRVKERPDQFQSFTECLKWLKKTVYLVVRRRSLEKDGKTIWQWDTLGSGFLIAPNRFATSNHVVNDPSKGDRMTHKDGDVYFLIRHDDENDVHMHWYSPELNKQIFLYPEVDLAILYLNDSFYEEGNKKYAKKDDYISVSKNFSVIGTPVGILGYPVCTLGFANNSPDQPLLGNILLRTDQGVVNCRYQKSEKDFYYEFTISFNPGNSGGPIFDTRTGKLLSIVTGYNAIPINQRETTISDDAAKQLKHYKEKSFIETVHAIYSVGYATPSFLEIFRKHSIIK